MIDLNAIQLTAIGGTFALLWGRIQGFIDFLTSMVVEKYEMFDEDGLFVKYFLNNNCTFKIEWSKSFIDRTMYLKSLKSRRTCKFIFKRQGIYFFQMVSFLLHSRCSLVLFSW